jgi:hypothetical protein
MISTVQHNFHPFGSPAPEVGIGEFIVSRIQYDDLCVENRAG